MGGASAGGVPAADYHYGVPTEEIPGGIDLVPVMGCGAPSPGFRPNLLLLDVCFLGRLSFSFAGAAGIGGASGGGMPAEGAQPTAVPPPDYWRPEQGYYYGRSWAPPSPGGAPPSPEYEPEEVEQPTLNGDHGSARGGGFYIDDRYGVDITTPLYRAGSDNIADIFTRPLHPQAVFYAEPTLLTMALSCSSRRALTTTPTMTLAWTRLTDGVTLDVHQQTAGVRFYFDHGQLL
ncbi:hypothetical protein CYMTET_16050 [Cymbomonas tetramitiformis]|uniref:Uncharacterized protein n=1 Tax=Cymbomonas tetramitiformis TaxID=36881 RepID=A0AAE0L8D9_9CHLO|nr:hypothetical protein CYMTET_16050 [Cymbomonas tetramitiformis]